VAGKRDIAWVADKIVAQLRTSLAGVLTGLEVEYADGVDLEVIPNSHFFISERQKLPAFPLVCVIPDNTDALPFSGEVRYDIEYHYLTVAVARTANKDEDTLKRQTLRTVRGIEEVFLDHRTLGGSVDDVLILTKEYGPLLTAQDSMLQEGQITVRVQTRVE